MPVETPKQRHLHSLTARKIRKSVGLDSPTDDYTRDEHNRPQGTLKIILCCL